MDQASSMGLASRSAATGSGAGLGLRSRPAGPIAGIDVAGEARLGGVGAMCGCRGRLAVQRSVHALASLQYQRMSTHA
jgi:hypothetical protein